MDSRDDEKQKRQIRLQQRKDKRLNRAILILGVVIGLLVITSGVMLFSYFGKSRDSSGSTTTKVGTQTSEKSTSGDAGDNKSKSEDADSKSEDADKKSDSNAESDEATPTPTEEAKPSQLDVGEISSKNAVLYRVSDWSVVYDKGAEERIYPASMTKIMTALVMLENEPDLDQTMVIDTDSYNALYEADASVAGFDPGETVTVRDLLYGMLLPSGADCSMTAAVNIGGSEAGYVDMMNQKAAELGMTNTHFANCTGLHDDNHYSTVADIAKLLNYALQDGNFQAVITKDSYTTQPTDVHPDGVTLRSTLFRAMATAGIEAPEIMGGKTGFTDEAGLCLASVANVNGEEYILVTAGAGGSSSEEPNHVIDAHNIYSHIQ